MRTIFRQESGDNAGVLPGAGLARPAQAGAILLIALVLSVHFFTTIHEMVAYHAICPEHGELIDVDSSALAAGLASPDIAGTSALFAAIGLNSDGHHQHCVFMASRNRRHAFVLAMLTSTPTLKLLPSVRVSTATAPPPSVATYLVAPKHSPPAPELLLG